MNSSDLSNGIVHRYFTNGAVANPRNYTYPQAKGTNALLAFSAINISPPIVPESYLLFTRASGSGYLSEIRVSNLFEQS
jgi:hypothetical protein